MWFKKDEIIDNYTNRNMKRITTLLAIMMLAVCSLLAQSPEKFTYQAVVRNASDALVANAPVGIRVSILQGSAAGNAVYVETQTVTTNANGLLTLEIGGGNAQQGTFADIDWANGPYFLKTETDPNGESNYSITSTQQMLSVPYALYAKDAGNIPTIPTNVSAFDNDAGYLTNYTENDPVFNAWDKNYNDLTNKPMIPTIPTNVSAFTNDAGYITSYTETDPNVPAWAKESTKPNYDYSEIANTPTIPIVPTNVSAFENDVPYLTSFTEQQVLSISNDTIFLTGGSFVKLPEGFDGDYNALTNKPVLFSGNYNDLTNTPQIPQIPTDISYFNNDAGYINNYIENQALADVTAIGNSAGSRQLKDISDPTESFDAVNLHTLTLMMDSMRAEFQQMLQQQQEDMQHQIDSLKDVINSFHPNVPPVACPSVKIQPVTFYGQQEPLCPNFGLLTIVAVDSLTGDQIPNLSYTWSGESVNNSSTNDTSLIYIMPDWYNHQYEASVTVIDTLTGCTATATYTLDVRDTLPPVVQDGVLENRRVLPTSEGKYYIPDFTSLLTTATVSDNCYPFSTLTINQSPAAGTEFFETTTVTITLSGPCGDENQYFVQVEPWILDTICFPSTLCNGYSNATLAINHVPVGFSCTFQNSTRPSNVPEGNLVTENTIVFDFCQIGIWPLQITDLHGNIVEYSVVIRESLNYPVYGANEISVTQPTSSTSFGQIIIDTIAGFSYTLTNSQQQIVSDNNLPEGTYTLTKTFLTTGCATDTVIYVVFEVVESDGQPCLGTPTVTDYDGNTYNTVHIGNQCWLKENMRTTHYADGTAIPAGGPYTNDTLPYYFDYSSSAIPLTQRGYLYNWPAAMRAAPSSSANPSGVQGICPTGWHVPSDAEWTQLTDYVSSQSEYLCSNNTVFIAKVLASTTGWVSSSYSCAVGNEQNLNNSTSFGAIPAGYKYNLGFTNSGKYAYFWSSTEASSGNAWYRYLNYNYTYVYRNNYDKNYGFSVRCLRNPGGGGSDTTTQTSLPTVSMHTSANETDSIVCGSEVMDDGGSPIIACGVCWSTNGTPTIGDNHTVDSISADGTFTSVINTTDWEPCRTLYYFRSYATNSNGISYSDVTMSLYVQKDTLAPYIQHPSLNQIPYIRLLPVRDNNCTYNAPSKEVMVNALLPLIHDDYTDMSFDYLMGHAEFYWENTNISAPGQSDIFNTQNHLTIVVVVEDQCGNELNHVVFYIDRPDDMTSIITPSVTRSDTAICENETVVLTFDSSKVASSNDFEVAHPLSFEWICLENDVVFSNANSVETVVTPNHSDTTYHFQMKVTDRYGCIAYSETCSVQVLDNEICHPSTPVHVQPCPGTPTVIDYDGNVYNTVQIGQQCWMKENLRTTREPDGTVISGRYYPNNDINNVAVYGYLYHWYAVMNGASPSSANPSGVQGICPLGWHVPSNAEWEELENYLGSQSQYFCNNDSSYIAKALASATGWNSPEGMSCLCCVGNNQSANNATGFGALPSGNYYFDSSISFGDNAYFWSSTELSNGSAWYCGLVYSDAHVLRYTSDKSKGYSVRCLRD